MNSDSDIKTQLIKERDALLQRLDKSTDISKPMRPQAAASWIALLYFAAFGSGLVGVVEVFHDGMGHLMPSYTWWQAARESVGHAGRVALLLAAEILLLKNVTGRSPFGRWRERGEQRRSAAFRQLAAGFGCVSIAAACFRAMSWLGADSAPSYGPFVTPRFVVDLVKSVLAGFEEEVLFCVLIPVLVRASRPAPNRSWLWAGIGLSALLRVLFHLYYNPAAVILVVWAIAAPLIVLATRSLWGVIIVHSAFDVTSSLMSLSQCNASGAHCIGHPTIAALAGLLMTLCCFGVGISVAVAALKWARSCSADEVTGH